ncbi:MAG: chemotaxis protein CheB, partial [Terriglobia bacterium]
MKKPSSKRTNALPAKARRTPGAKPKLALPPSGSLKASEKSPFPVVGIGASAGGLEAFTRLLEHLPAVTGMSFVLVQHLMPKHESILAELLSKKTRMPVNEVKNGMMVKPDHVYVIPPNTSMAIRKGVLRLMPRQASPTGPALPIDLFLQSLAVDRGDRAIGVILSGTASDGTLGLQAIKSENGITFAQDEQSAKYSGMPRSAIATGCVDFVLPPEEIAAELVRIGSHPYVAPARAAKDILPEGETDLRRIFVTLRLATGIDFALYKRNTIKRRIKRRMVVHKLEKLSDYAQLIQKDPDETSALFQDILIHVTSFFRDPQTFEALSRKVFPRLVKGQRDEPSVRIWVPGCSTGEEAYSIAICLMEYLQSMKGPRPAVQIFGTDIDDAALRKARAGIYPENIAVSPQRLKRFFVKLEHGYQVNKTIREMCIFSKQNVFADPPFAKLDLISCRNLLIYLESELQKKVIPLFHYALRPRGFLMLGSSESVGAEFAELFDLVDRKQKIYARNPAKTQTLFSLSTPVRYTEQPLLNRKAEDAGTRFDLEKSVNHILLSRLTLPALLVDNQMHTMEFRGNVDPYLELSPGKASLHLAKLVREGLMLHLRAAIDQARKENLPVRKDGIQFKSNGQLREVSLEVVPVRGPALGEIYFLALFQDVASPPPLSEQAPRPGKRGKRSLGALERENLRLSRYNAQLQHELEQNKANLVSSIEEHETTTEELRASNEEILSSNEELQSINEELETAKEELQSSNEELATLNEELRNRNLDLNQANSDLNNLLSNINFPILVLSKDMRIRHFTPLAGEAFNLAANDIGLPVGSVKTSLNVPNLEELVHDSVTHAVTKDQEVQDRQGYWYSLRIQPYKTLHGEVEGSVLAWLDIETLRRSLKKAERSLGATKMSLRQTEDRYRLLFERNLAGVYFSTADGRMLECNQAFAQILGYATVRDILDHRVEEICFDNEHQQNLITQLRLRSALTNIECRLRRKDGAPVDVLMNCNLSRLEGETAEVIESIVMDITSRIQAEQATKDFTGREMRSRDEERRRVSRELHDSVGSSLTALIANLSLMQKLVVADKSAQKQISESLDLAKECSREVRTLSYLLHPPLLDELGLESAIRSYLDGFSERSGVTVSLDIPPALKGSERLPPHVETALFRIVQESLTNIHTHSGSSIAGIHISRSGSEMTLEVRDHGRGIPAEYLRANSQSTKLGVGISGMRERMKQLGGELAISSE